jgi:hypothetical protein
VIPVAYTDGFLDDGQWIFVHDLKRCADGTPAGAVALAKRAGARGLLVKVLDGGTRYADGGAYDILAECQRQGLECSGWGYCYPGDGANVAALIQDWLRRSGNSAFLLDVESEFERAPDPTGSAMALLSAVAQVCGRPWYTSFAWPDQHAAFPWSAFHAACRAFAPQVYGALLAGQDGPVSDAWADLCWNRAAIGTQAGGPAYTNGGPQGWEALPPIPVVPIFDLSNIARFSYLAHNGGFRAVCWWLLDGLTEAQADELARTPYAVQYPAQTQAASQVPDLDAARAALARIDSAVADLRRALGAGNG